MTIKAKVVAFRVVMLLLAGVLLLTMLLTLDGILSPICLSLGVFALAAFVSSVCTEIPNESDQPTSNQQQQQHEHRNHPH